LNITKEYKMQIRRVKNRYQLIRYAGFEKATRKIKTEMVGSVPLGSRAIPEPIAVKLRPEEFEALSQRLVSDQLAVRPAEDRLALAGAVETFAAIVRAIDAGESMPPAEILRSLVTDLHAALRRRVGPGKKVVRKRKLKVSLSAAPL
jgi:hypothetical protein